MIQTELQKNHLTGEIARKKTQVDTTTIVTPDKVKNRSYLILLIALFFILITAACNTEDFAQANVEEYQKIEQILSTIDQYSDSRAKLRYQVSDGTYINASGMLIKIGSDYYVATADHFFGKTNEFNLEIILDTGEIIFPSFIQRSTCSSTDTGVTVRYQSPDKTTEEGTFEDGYCLIPVSLVGREAIDNKIPDLIHEKYTLPEIGDYVTYINKHGRPLLFEINSLDLEHNVFTAKAVVSDYLNYTDEDPISLVDHYVCGGDSGSMIFDSNGIPIGVLIISISSEENPGLPETNKPQQTCDPEVMGRLFNWENQTNSD